MKNITKKDLQKMIELMGNRAPINENKNISSIELIKKSPNGKYYGIVREIKKYYIKESNDGFNFDFIGGVANKIKTQFESYEQAVRRLNLMLEDTDVLTPDIIEEKKFVIKTKKKKSTEPKADEGGFDFGGEETSDEGGDFDFGGEEETSEEGGNFGGEEGEDTSSEEGGDFDFGGEETEEGTEEGGEDFDFGGEEETDEDLDLEDDSEDSIKTIQRMTGKLGQKLRDTEDVSSDMSKWVAKSVLSALNLEDMDSEDKKDLIRTIKKKKDEGSDEEFDFMADDAVISRPIMTYMSDDMVDWNNLSDEEKSNIVNVPGDMEKPMMDWDEEREYDYEDACSHCGGLGHDDMTGEECEWCMGTGVEDMENYMEDYMEDEDDMYGPGDDELEGGEQILSDDDGCSYCGDRMDYMAKHYGNVKKHVKTPGKKLESYELDDYLKKLKNKLGGSDNVSIDGDKVVGDSFYVQVAPTGYKVYKEGEKFSKNFTFSELGDLRDYVREGNEDYMDDPYMMPQPAPARPQTTPDTPTKPAKPGTDKPSPSKRPFTPPPHITPGEEPNPKAKYSEEEYGPTEGMDYMEDDSMEMCQACQGRGHEMGLGFNRTLNTCITCAGTGSVPRMEVDGEVDEPYTDSLNPMGYQEPTSTLPKNMGYKYQYKEKFNFPFGFQENSKGRKIMKEDHINDKMASYEQEMAYEDVEAMARQHGMDVEFCHKDMSKDPEEQTVYLDLMKKGKAVAQIRINSAGQIEMGSLKGKSFKGEPVDSHSDFDEVLGEKNIKTPMNPAPAPAKPQTKPETPVKPGKPGTDKPSPSKRPFTPPPHITPGEEPSPKAGRKK